MKFITLALALLGVVGAVRLDQTPAMNTMSLISAKEGGAIDDELFKAIESSPSKSLTRDQMHKVIDAFLKKLKVKVSAAQLKEVSDYMFDMADKDTDGKVTKTELEVMVK